MSTVPRRVQRSKHVDLPMTETPIVIITMATADSYGVSEHPHSYLTFTSTLL